ncbi:MAG: Gmad2 immunoglobulin-like domain-containing protein [Acidimicrobiia bacterium]
MNDEKKLKDLIRRLVAMTPEPPPFPEEVPMARRETTKRNPRPMLVFAGAAVIVIGLAVPLLLFFRGSSPEVVATTTTVAPVTSTTQQQESTTTTPNSTTTQPVPYTWQGVIFVAQEPEGSFTGNPALIPLSIQVPDPTGMLGSGANFTDVLPLIDVGPSGFVNAIPTDVRVLSASLPKDGVVEVEMNQAFLDGAGGLLADFTMLNQLIYTLTSTTDESGSVLFLVDGQPVTQFGTEGLDLSDPVDRDTFIDNLALIFLTDPITEAEHVYIVSGRANTFEAMLTVQVVDPEGNVVHEEPVQASCGTGCWGEFGVGVSSDLIEPGQASIRLLTYSAEDGSAQNIITVPIPENNEWIAVIGE